MKYGLLHQISLFVSGLLALAAVLSLGISDRWEVWLILPIPNICVFLLIAPIRENPWSSRTPKTPDEIRKLLLIGLEPEENDFDTGGADNPRIGSISAHHRSSASASPTFSEE